MPTIIVSSVYTYSTKVNYTPWGSKAITDKPAPSWAVLWAASNAPANRCLWWPPSGINRHFCLGWALPTYQACKWSSWWWWAIATSQRVRVWYWSSFTPPSKRGSSTPKSNWNNCSWGRRWSVILGTHLLWIMRLWKEDLRLCREEYQLSLNIHQLRLQIEN